jgi:hypothetical protein
MDEGQRDTDSKEASDIEPAGDELPPLPESLIPRWLAAVVLLLLVASGVATTWLVLTG